MARIDNDGFRSAHAAVASYLLKKSGGKPFRDFRHPTLWLEEIKYKVEALDKARKILTRRDWPEQLEKPGTIQRQVRRVCGPGVSENLLEHRWGPPGAVSAELPTALITDLETRLVDFFNAAERAREEFGVEFDRLAEFLRDRHLQCRWQFVSYLAFLANESQYFTVRPRRLDLLLAHYGIEERIFGDVSWDRYCMLLEVAEEIRDRLPELGPAGPLELQSYMWVAAHEIEMGNAVTPVSPEEPDFATEQKRRADSERENQRIGVLGEKHVYYQEKAKLEDAGRSDLARRVRLVSDDTSRGFDILSYTLDGEELHIEVKATVRSEKSDIGFWLSENERATAATDPHWRLYRVWLVDADPETKDLGNIIRSQDQGWLITPSQYYVRRAQNETSQ